MGTHTWFVKDGDLQIELWNQKNSMFTDDTPEEVYDEWYNRYKSNRIEEDNKYLNLFRVRVSEKNWDTIDELYLRSYEQTLKFIEDSEYEIVVGDYPWDEGMKLLKEYWEEYPNGMIYFG
jgi:hypothetical protein